MTEAQRQEREKSRNTHSGSTHQPRSRQWIPAIALVVSSLALASSIRSCMVSERAQQVAERLSTVNVEVALTQQIEVYHRLDDQIRVWERENKLERRGPTVSSIEELNRELDERVVPEDQADLYRRRFRKYQRLEQLALVYDPLEERVARLGLRLPEPPKLPALVGVPLAKLRCIVGGIHGICGDLLTDSGIKFPPQLFPETAPREMFLRFRAYERPGGLLFDLAYFNHERTEIVTIERSRWKVTDSRYRFAADESKLEVIEPSGRPALQVYVDRGAGTVYLGGRFYSTEGEPIVAIPGLTITPRRFHMHTEIHPGASGFSSGISAGMGGSATDDPHQDLFLPEPVLGKTIKIEPVRWFKGEGSSASLDEESFNAVRRIIEKYNAEAHNGPFRRETG